MSSEEKSLLLPLFADSVTTSWTWKRLDAIADVYDCPHSTPKLVNDLAAPFVVRSQDVRSGTFLLNDAAHVSSETYAERIKRVEPRYGDLVYSREGTYFGIAAEVPEGIKVCLGQRMVLIRPDSSRIDHRFLRYWLNSPQVFGHIHGFRDGTVAERLNLPVIRGLAIAFPSQSEQRAIAESLSVLDDRITLLRETNATLEAIAQALFKSWFVDFDPVRAKQEWRAPEGMSDATAALFPDSFEASELGLVPKGWRYSTVGESFILTMGQSPPGDTYNETRDGLPFYQGRTDFGFRFPSQRVYCTAPTRIAEPGDTLVSVRAPVGDVNMALEKCCLGRGVAGLRHIRGCNSFAFYTLKGLRAQFDLFDSEGTVFGSINKKDFRGLPVLSPSDDVLFAFDDIATPIDRRVIENEEQIRTLAALRDTLLPRLISGQLRLPEAEALIEEATA